MKKCKDIFSASHTIYRFLIASNDVKNFMVGVCRTYKSIFDADKVMMICKNVNSYSFIKLSLRDKKQQIKKGGISILNSREKNILNQEREIILNNRLVYPFIFVDTLGAIYVERKSAGNREFNELEKKWFLYLCQEVSISLKIFNLYREEKRIMINYIKSLTQLLEQHIPTSYLHIKSIFRLIRAVGKKAGLCEAEIKSLEYASLLHDAGKIELPSRILKKQKPLTDKEFKIIMKHPRKGVRLIKDVEILKPVIPIILHHHERYDGKGYPYKLKKEQIPLGSRILSVIDAFDAMYFGRPYKKKKYLKGVEKEIKKQAGRQFDPKIVDIFLKVVERKDIKKYLHFPA